MQAKTQKCRDCGRIFPYDEEADRCPACADEMIGIVTPEVGDVFYREGDSAKHTVLAFGEHKLTMLVRREAWGLAPSFTYWCDSRIEVSS